MDNKVFNKIEKLLALSSSSNPHEAASALAAAQRLMAEHGLTQTDVSIGSLSHEGVSSRFSSTKPRDFEVVLGQTVCRAFGCSLLWQGIRGSYGLFQLVGPRSRVPAASHFLQVLMRKMAGGRAEFLRSVESGPGKTRAGDSWCRGYALAVSQAVAEVAGVIADPEDVKRYAETRLGADGSKARLKDRRGEDRLGFLSGLDHGSKERLYRPMTESTSTKLSQDNNP